MIFVVASWLPLVPGLYFTLNRKDREERKETSAKKEERERKKVQLIPLLFSPSSLLAPGRCVVVVQFKSSTEHTERTEQNQFGFFGVHRCDLWMNVLL